MEKLIRKYLPKLFIQQWIVGVARGNMADIIRTRQFNPEIEWMPAKGAEMLYADPFLYKTGNGYSILFEDYSMYDNYGKISVIPLGEKMDNAIHKVVLDTHSHLSYPFLFEENGITYMFPEASQSGKLSCYRFDTTSATATYVQDIMDRPLLDGTIHKHGGLYWLFGTINGPEADNKLHLFYSTSLMGPYQEHPSNPVRSGLEGSRPAGKIVEVDGQLYRPAQNSLYAYGESITINRITRLTEKEYSEEVHMVIRLDRKQTKNRKMHGIHTINHIDDLIVVDGTVWRFSPALKWKQVRQKMKT